MVNKRFAAFVVFLSCIILLCNGCDSSMLSTEEFIQWVDDPDNGLIQEQVVGEYKFIFQYRPTAYMVLKDLDANELDINQAMFDSTLREYNGLQYGILKIGTVKGNDEFLKQSVVSEQEYFDRIQYFTSSVQNDLYLLNEQDTLPCKMLHFERTFSINSFDNIILGFEADQKETDKTIVFSDKALGTGDIKFFIPGKVLANIPQIAF